MKIWCPRCDQGWIGRFRQKKTGEVVLVCKECEALWTENEKITADHFTDFTAYFKAKNMSVEWRDMDELIDD